MPPKPPPPVPGVPRGRLPSVREEDGRAARQTREPTLTGIAPPAPAPGSVAPPPPPRRRASDGPDDTGQRSAESLVTELARKSRETAELRRQLAEATRPATVDSEPPPPSKRSQGRARAAKAAVGILVAALGALGGAGGSEGLKALRWSRGEAPVTQAQIDNLRADLDKARAEVTDLRDYLAAAYGDEEGFRMLSVAYFCSQRQLLASGVDCREVLSVVPVNPSPLTAAKPAPQLVIPGPLARKPEPRLPPNGR